jgi:hypothetical protein
MSQIINKFKSTIQCCLRQENSVNESTICYQFTNTVFNPQKSPTQKITGQVLKKQVAKVNLQNENMNQTDLNISQLSMLIASPVKPKNINNPKFTSTILFDQNITEPIGEITIDMSTIIENDENENHQALLFAFDNCLYQSPARQINKIQSRAVFNSFQETQIMDSYGFDSLDFRSARSEMFQCEDSLIRPIFV